MTLTNGVLGCRVSIRTYELVALLVFLAYAANAQSVFTYSLPNGQEFHMKSVGKTYGADGTLIFVEHGAMPCGITALLEALNTNSLCATSKLTTRSRATLKALDWEDPKSGMIKGILITAENPGEMLEFSVSQQQGPQALIFNEGSEYTFLGSVEIGNIKVFSDAVQPLQLKIVREGSGYKYMSGKGTVTVNGVETKLGQ